MPAVPPLTLRNGVTIDDPLATTLEFIELDSSYLKYDRAEVALDDDLTREDIRVANWMIARMSPAVIDGIQARAGGINKALAQISPSVSLTDPRDEIPWLALYELFGAIAGAPEVGLARATKVLHKKRPALIPILDSVLEKYLRRIDEIPRQPDFAGKAVELIRSYKRELDASVETLRALQVALADQSIDLTELRLLDLFLWGYSETYTPLYRRDDASASAWPAASAAPRLAGRQPLDGVGTFDVELFRDDDAGYTAWLAAHPAGFVLNTSRSPSPGYLILHRATCRTISGTPTRGGPWTGPYIKVCGDDELTIAAWAGAIVSAAPRRCRICA